MVKAETTRTMSNPPMMGVPVFSLRPDIKEEMSFSSCRVTPNFFRNTIVSGENPAVKIKEAARKKKVMSVGTGGIISVQKIKVVEFWRRGKQVNGEPGLRGFFPYLEFQESGRVCN